MNEQPTDPRPSLDRSMMTATDTIFRLAPGDADRPTPCADWTTRDIACHLVAVVDRITAIGEGRNPGELPVMRSELKPGEWSAAMAESVEAARQVWSDDSLLARDVTVPWGQTPGAVALGVYSSEILVHTWDLCEGLATAPRWDESDVRDALAIARMAIPATPRGEQIPFDPPTSVPDGSPPIVELAAWLGRVIPTDRA